MEHVAPLIQTVLWVGLIGGIVWRFHAPIYGLLTALQQRVESGSTVKAGPFELIDQLRPQEPEKQKQKAEAEVLEALPPQPESTLAAPALPRLVPTRQAVYFQAEDLALRAIQAEYGQPISRQVTAGSDLGFDGVFTVNGRLNIVEVKYVREINAIPRIRSSLERLASAIQKYNWRNAQVILVLVFEREEDVTKADMYVLQATKDLGVPVTTRPYSLPELQRRFGLEGSDGG